MSLQMHIKLQFTRKSCSYSLRFINMVVDLFDKLDELWTVPVALDVRVWLAEVDVEQLSKDQTYRSLGRPRHRLQQQRYNRLLHRIRQTHLSPVNR